MGVHIRFKEFLQERYNRTKAEGIVFDFAWIGGKYACWRPIKSYRTVKRGKKKGQIQVELYCPTGKKIIVPGHHVKYKDD